LDGHDTIDCRARRRLRRDRPDDPEFPLPGDDVEWRPHGAGPRPEGVIEAVRPRRNEVARTRFGAKHVVVANLDQMVVVVAARDPALDRGLLDRLLAIAELNHLQALVCLNKADLVDPEALAPVATIYERAGYRVLFTSAETGLGIESLRESLRGHTSALMGPSGAGKSRLIGLLEPGLELRTGDVSERSGQGRHTTTRVDLHRTGFGALLADTPGVRDFNLWRTAPEELSDLFPELRAEAGGCKFRGCIHVHEPDCAVKEAVSAGTLDASRYRSYAVLLEELSVQRGERDREGRSRKE
jgi:ribosome biogenesis GTPase